MSDILKHSAKHVESAPYDINKIMSLIPHRYPFLLVDKVLELVPYDSIKVLKNVTMNEPFFQGHFPEIPIMPGVLIVEAMAQAVAVMSLSHWDPEKTKPIFLLTGINKVRIKKPVQPGDALIIHAKMGRNKQMIYKSTAEAFVNGELVCSAELTAAVKEV